MMGSSTATLPEKLYAMAEDTDNRIVCWGEDGNSLIFKDTSTKALEEILPRYNVKATKWASLAKQLQNYEFAAFGTGGARSSMKEYYHVHHKFVRGKPGLLLDIKTKVKKCKEKQVRRERQGWLSSHSLNNHSGKSAPTQETLSGVEHTSSLQEQLLLNSFMEEQRALFAQQNAMIKNMSLEIKHLKSEVSCVHTQLASLRKLIPNSNDQQTEIFQKEESKNGSNMIEPIPIESIDKHMMEGVENFATAMVSSNPPPTPTYSHLHRSEQFPGKRSSLELIGNESAGCIPRATKNQKSNHIDHETSGTLTMDSAVTDSDFLDNIDIAWLCDENDNIADADEKRERNSVLKAVKEHGLALEDTSVAMRGDREIVLEAVKQNWKQLAYASDNLKGDREVVLEACNQMRGMALAFASKDLKGDRQFVLEAIRTHGWVLQFATDELKHDRNFILQAVKENWKAIQVVSETYLGDRDIALEAVKQNGLALAFTTKEVKGDCIVVFEAVRQNGSALEYASKELRGSSDHVLTAVKQNGLALMYASSALKDDYHIVVEAIRQNPGALSYASDRLQGDHTIVVDAIREDGEKLIDVFDALRFNNANGGGTVLASKPEL